MTLGAGFDSNLYYSSSRENSSIRQVPEGYIEPSLKLSTPNPAMWDLNGSAAVGWRQYLSSEETVASQSGLAANLGASLTWNPRGVFSLRLSENFVRTNEAPSYESADSVNRIFNRAGAMLGFHPGGRVLESYLSYDFSLYRHNLYEELDRSTHHVGWKGHWSFLPKTALVAKADYRRINYVSAYQGGPSGDVVSPEGRLRNANSTPLRLTGGLRGLLTQRITLGLQAGYGWGFYEANSGPDFKGLLVQAEASYQFGPVELDSRIRAGYQRDFTDSTLGNYYTYHRALVGFQQGLVGGRLRLGLEADAQMRDYADLGVRQVVTQDNVITLPENVSDLLVGVLGETSFEIRKGWDLGLSYRFVSNFTEDIIEVEGLGENSVRDYQRHHVVLSTTLTY
ncbi:hypothetical protein DL240_01920 [Lujinxingia litoralis]|uniref:Uncharacterized protein n=1 Tax=Lujinxingia litoralis TaxID=2211119 RepID=A0A328CA42_9DELT|nr:hypothetical protein DL240_01920 [Lujinxingia litoralis]